ncbi:hypothetical protein M427DRAFT_51703 [Gonapodya prolifera JEL478]|uniref:Uncharacterized protein n=1 Tax=Gonapodya prolifera (strain JEL478) TaxID=1344416 RepID=A0A139AVJ3_GONPJ|nr:hypothetical protein M427DRAFT_51703 [Gonapodya prolifera JEL478]|eukprot:KXS20724.1 hypothetical protein M427DRAFT_51703 [Gonapodya prolifera JEL478]
MSGPTNSDLKQMQLSWHAECCPLGIYYAPIGASLGAGASYFISRSSKMDWKAKMASLVVSSVLAAMAAHQYGVDSCVRTKARAFRIERLEARERALLEDKVME